MKSILNNQHLGIFLFRVFLCLQILHGVLDNILSWNRMLEFRDYLQSEGFPFPLISAILSVYGQFFAALFLLIGYKSRWAAAVLVLNFWWLQVFTWRIMIPFQPCFPLLTFYLEQYFFFLTGPGDLRWMQTINRVSNKPGLSLLKEKNHE